jgi:hypothetical protein
MICICSKNTKSVDLSTYKNAGSHTHNRKLHKTLLGGGSGRREGGVVADGTAYIQTHTHTHTQALVLEERGALLLMVLLLVARMLLSK